MKLRIIAILGLVGLLIIISTSCEKEEDNPIKTEISILNPLSWKSSSVPLRFSESSMNNDLTSNYNRAKISWFIIPEDYAGSDDPLTETVFYDEFYTTNSNPSEIINILNISFYPNEREMYNFDCEGSAYSSGINEDGFLNEPESRWGGIQRAITNNLIQFKYIDFWMQNPFGVGQVVQGKLIIDYGEVSEDILKDGLMAAESNISTSDIESDSSSFGIIGQNDSDLFLMFSNHELQDVGLDGLPDEQELEYFSAKIKKYEALCNNSAISTIKQDPCADNFIHYKSSTLESTLNKFSDFNGLEDNSPLNASDDNLLAYTSEPDAEDLNNDRVLSTKNNYYEYEINLEPDKMKTGLNYIIETKIINNVEWLHFNIPTADYDQIIGDPQNFGFIRIYLAGFDSVVYLRIVDLKLKD